MSSLTPEERVEYLQKAGTFAAIILALLVGMLIGKEHCHEAAPPPEEPQALYCPEPPAPVVIADCPEPEEEEEVAEAPPRPRVPPAPQPPPPQEDALPDSPPPPSPAQRAQLLQWARGESVSLRSCPRDPGTTYRIAVTVHLRAGMIDQVSINADDTEIPPDLSRCLRDQIARWVLPDDLVPEQDRVFFRLTI